VIQRRLLPLLAAAALLCATAVQAETHNSKIKHVLLISVDGMHAVDFMNCAHGLSGVNDGEPYCPTLAALGQTGVHYNAASTSKPSDSFPGLMSIVSGATQRTLGVYYDVAYDRSLDGPELTTGNGNAAAPCTPYARPTGYTTEYEEGIDLDQSKVNGGAPGASLTDGTAASIDPKKLDRDPARGCAPVYPWQFVRTNTIFGVIHNAGGYASWFDKHPAYASVAGRDGIGVLDDFYGPEINSNVIGLPGVATPLGMDCSNVADPSQTGSWTDSFQNIQCYDTLKVNAILNQIAGKNHNGGPGKVPTIFGMNFQAVSVGEKLIEKNVGSGGYLDAAGTPSDLLLGEFQFVDASLAEMVQALKANGLWESTLVIVTAKHAQSPIDPNRFFPIPGHSGANGQSPATLLANLLPMSESPANPNGIGPTEDDVSLLWLADSSNTLSAVATLEANAAQAGIGQILYGQSLSLNYNWPGLGAGLDPRTPDIIVTPNYGVTYTGSSKKQEEHGGFSHDDTNVILLISGSGIKPGTVFSEVGTNQVAPTILRALGLDPNELDGVRLEGTQALAALPF